MILTTDSILMFLRENLVLAIMALLLDHFFGDPVYKFHPVRIMGFLLGKCESLLRSTGLSGKAGGTLLFFQVTGVLLFCVYGIHSLLAGFHWFLGFAWHVFLAFSFIALKDLVLHSNRISTAVESGDLKMARHHCSMLMGRDVSRLDGKGCNRAGIESVSESLVDGVLSPLFWLFFTGIYGMLIFKIISTMDSMVGYKNEKYLHFGWFGARSDDLFNYIPARLSWILIGLTAWLLPGFSAPKA